MAQPPTKPKKQTKTLTTTINLWYKPDSEQIAISFREFGLDRFGKAGQQAVPPALVQSSAQHAQEGRAVARGWWFKARRGRHSFLRDPEEEHPAPAVHLNISHPSGSVDLQSGYRSQPKNTPFADDRSLILPFPQRGQRISVSSIIEAKVARGTGTVVLSAG